MAPASAPAVAAAGISPTAVAFAPGAIAAFTTMTAGTSIDQLPVAEAVTAPAPAVTPTPGPTSIATLRRPENNDGVWIGYAQRRWISAGPAVLHSDTWFTRVGEYAGFPVFKRTGVSEDVIYVPTREGYVAPYRLRP
jgi:hypothetical protein